MKFSEKLSKAVALSALLLVPGLAYAQETDWTDKIDFDARLTLQYITEDNTDLGTIGEKDDSFSQQLQILTGVDFTPELYGFFHGRALNLDGDTGFQDDDDTDISSSGDVSFLELRELYLLKKNLLGITPVSLQVGRQRVREARSLWWNSDNDLVRVHYNTTLLNGFLAAGEDLSSYRNNTNGDFQEDDEKRFRVLGEGSWQYVYNHFLEGRFAYENDHSGIESPGTVISALDRDTEDANLLWFGVRSAGEFTEPADVISRVKYRADIIGLVGEEDQIASVAGPDATTRTVTGSNSRDVRAWAFDGAVTVDPFASGGTLLSLGYATGSGDDDSSSGTDNEFRQTDLQGGSSRIGLERSAQRNYGEVLRPELSNIHILNAAIGYPINDAIDIGLSYFYYHLAEDATSLRSSGISAPLNGNDKSVGQEIDASFNIDLDKQFGRVPYVKGMDLRFVAGSFFPGDAYEPADDDAAFRAYSELKFSF